MKETTAAALHDAGAAHDEAARRAAPKGQATPQRNLGEARRGETAGGGHPRSAGRCDATEAAQASACRCPAIIS